MTRERKLREVPNVRLDVPLARELRRIAVDRFDGELVRRGCAKRSRYDYFRKLAPLCDLLPDAAVTDVTEDDCRAHLTAGATGVRTRSMPASRGRSFFAARRLPTSARDVMRHRPFAVRTSTWSAGRFEFAGLLRLALDAGAIGAAPDAYVIPMVRDQRRKGDRDDRIVSRIIKRLGDRAGVVVSLHPLRAALAVRFLETIRASWRRCSG